MTDEQRRRAPARCEGDARVVVPAGRGAQDAGARPSRCCARWPRPAPSAATSWWRWAAAWWATWPASAPPSTSAACATCRCRPRWWRRSTRPTAGKTGVDLPEGKNYAGAYHQPAAVLCDPAALDTLPPEELAAGYAEVVKTALIAGGRAVGAGAPGRPPGRREILGCVRTKLAVVAEDERDGGRRQVLNLGPHGGARDRGGHRLRALPPRRGGGHRPAGRAAAVGPRRAARRGGRSCWRRAACRSRSRARASTRWWRSSSATRSAAAGACRSCWWRRRAQVTPGHEVEPERAARRGRGGARGVNDRVDVLHGVNLDVLGRRDAAHYGGLTLTELEVRVRRFARELGLEAAFFQTNHEGEYCEDLHRAGEGADGLVLNPGAWTHYSWAIRDALEVAGLPAVEVHLSAVDEREEWRRSVGDRRPLRWPPCRARAWTATARRSSCCGRASTAMSARADRLAALLGRARARLPAGQRPGERALPHRLHRHQRRLRGHPRRAPVLDRLPLRRAGRRAGARLRAGRGGPRHAGRPRRAPGRAGRASTTPT